MAKQSELNKIIAQYEKAIKICGAMNAVWDMTDTEAGERKRFLDRYMNDKSQYWGLLAGILGYSEISLEVRELVRRMWYDPPASVMEVLKARDAGQGND